MMLLIVVEVAGTVCDADCSIFSQTVDLSPSYQTETKRTQLKNTAKRTKWISATSDFTFNRCCMKLFKTGSIDVVKDCQSYFAIDLPSCDLKRRQDKFILRYTSTVNVFCQFCNKL